MSWSPLRLGACFVRPLALAGVAVVWLTFAPTEFGGRVAYVVISGDSMERAISAGDLAVVRRTASYEVGDVVVYDHPEVGPVIHRLVGRNLDRFLARGDNNEFIDPFQPRVADIQGELWFSLPRVGGWVASVRAQPLIFGMVAVATVGLGGISMKRTRSAPVGVMAIRAWASTRAGDIGTVLVVVGMLAGALAFVAFRQPASYPVEVALPFTQTAVFEYSAASTNPAIYDTGSVTSGEPIYAQVSDEVEVRFTYALQDERQQPLPAEGSYALLVEVSNTQGWKRTMTIASGEFGTSPFSAAGSFTLSGLTAVIDGFESSTGSRQTQYTVALAPQVDVKGMIRGQALSERFQPRMKMVFDPLGLRLDDSTAGTDKLSYREDRAIRRSDVVTNTIPLQLVSPSVLVARVIALAVLVLVAIGGCVLGFLASSMFNETAGLAESGSSRPRTEGGTPGL